jgi:hypothetical protein
MFFRKMGDWRKKRSIAEEVEGKGKYTMCGNKKTSRNVFRPQLLSPGKNPLGLAWVGPPWSFDKHPFAADFRLYFGSKSRIRFLLLPQLRICPNLNGQKDLDYFFCLFLFFGVYKRSGAFYV